jgi:hypothetical protein
MMSNQEQSGMELIINIDEAGITVSQDGGEPTPVEGKALINSPPQGQTM